MLDHSSKDSLNFEARCLHEKASMLAASVFANSTKGNYGKAWGQYLQFCDKMGLNPMEASGRDIATWLVYRSEQTSSPNMLEANSKGIKCFRYSVNKHLSDLPLVDSVLKGLLKTKEAKELFRLGLEPEMVQHLIHNAIFELGPDSFVGIRHTAIYALMYWVTA